MKRVGDILKESEIKFNEALLLLSGLLNTDKSTLVAHPEMCVDSGTYSMWQTHHDRRLAGEPIAYILGSKEFYGLKFSLTPDVLIPRPESELIVDRAFEFINMGLQGGNNKVLVLEIATGSGAIILSLVNKLSSCQLLDYVDLTATDISLNALKVARKNARALNVEGVRFVQGDLFAPVAGNKFDLIMANLPYLPHGEAVRNEYEPQIALDGGDNGDELINRFMQEARHFLRPNGLILYETYGGVIKELTFDTMSKQC